MRRHNETFHERGYTDGKYNMHNIVGHRENANYNHDEIPLHTY